MASSFEKQVLIIQRFLLLLWPLVRSECYVEILTQNYFAQFTLTILNTPEATHTIKLALTDPVNFNTPVGDTKIPLPIIDPTITVMPFRSDIFASNAPPSFSLPSSGSPSDLRVSLSQSSAFFGDLKKKEQLRKTLFLIILQRSFRGVRPGKYLLPS